MVLPEQLTKAALRRPGERVIHVTNQATATDLYSRVARDPSKPNRVILNSVELKKEIRSRQYDRWVVRPLARVGNAAKVLASAPTMKVGDAEFSMVNLAIVDKQTSVASSGLESIFVFENSIDSDGFGRLLSYYSSAEPAKMPMIVVAADNDMVQLQAKLSRYSNSFTFHETYGSSSRYWAESSASPSMSLSEIVLGLTGNNTLAVANTNFSLVGVDHTDFEDLTHNLSAAYAIIRSVNFEYSKFAASKLTDSALALLSRLDERRVSDGQRKALYAIRAVFTLWNLYLREVSTERLDEAIRLAALTDSDLLTAHCHRLINLNAGYSEFSRHTLEQAELTFRRFNQDPMAIYCKNNALLNVMHQIGGTTDAFGELITEATEKAPEMYAMVSLLNNAGVGAILDSRYEEALGFFRKSAAYNAMPIHRLGLETNALICRFCMGDTITAEELDRLVTRLDRANIDRGYGYHQAIILLNVLRMQTHLGHSSTMTRVLLRERAFMNYGDVLEDKLSIGKFMEKSLPTTAPQGRYKGQRGDFISRTDLVPIIHFGWA